MACTGQPSTSGDVQIRLFRRQRRRVGGELMLELLSAGALGLQLSSASRAEQGPGPVGKLTTADAED